MSIHWMIKKITRVSMLFWIFAGLLLPTLVFAAPYLDIRSSSQTIFRNSQINVYERVKSNTLIARILQKAQFTVTEVTPIEAALGQEIIFSHKITNIGKTKLHFVGEITFETQGKSNYFPLDDFQVILDRNNDGLYSAGDLLLQLVKGANGKLSFVIPEEVLQNEFISILLAGAVPNFRQHGDKSIFSLELKAIDPEDDRDGLRSVYITHSLTDEITVKDKGALRLFARSDSSRILPNSDVNLALMITQSAGTDSLPTRVKLDGAMADKVYVELRIPDEMILKDVSLKSDHTEVFYHVANTPADTFTRYVPRSLNNLDAVMFAWNNFPAGNVEDIKVQLFSYAKEEETLTLQAYANQMIEEEPVRTSSNRVTLQVVNAGSILFMRDSRFDLPLLKLPLGNSIYLKVADQLCNVDKNSIESYRVKLLSEKAADLENSIIVTETDVNSGIYTAIVPTNLLSNTKVVQDDGILTLDAGDTVTAEFNCGSSAYSNTIKVTDELVTKGLIRGTIFDSRDINNSLVPNLTVQLYAVNRDAQIVLEDAGKFAWIQGDKIKPMSDGPRTFIGETEVNESGNFAFDDIELINSLHQGYILSVAGNEYQYPSTLGSYETFRLLDKSVVPFASYGGVFTMGAGLNAFFVDIPIDYTPDLSGALFIQKSVDKEMVEYGEVLTYSIDIQNKKATEFTQLSLHDQLPKGFMYVPNSARLDGAPLSKEPEGANSDHLVFTIDRVARDSKSQLTYQVRVRVTAPIGKARNIAQLIASKNIVSNTSSVDVMVRGGVFSDEAFIVGMIYMDCNNNGHKDPNEMGIPFVRLYLEDGTFVISDGEGKYSLYGLKSGTRVMKVDDSTLPKGAQLITLNNRFAKDPKSQFVDLKKGELHRADFAVVGCETGLIDEVLARQKKWSESNFAQLKMPSINSEGVRIAPNTTSEDNETALFLSYPGTQQMGSELLGKEPSLNDNITRNAIVPAQEIESIIREVENQLDFMGLENGKLLESAQRTIRVKGPLNGQLELKVDGKVIPVDRIGQLSKLENRNIQILDYIGVPFAAGNNQVELSLYDSFGNLRGNKSLNLILPGELQSIVITQTEEGKADGMTPLPITIQLLDKNGYKVLNRYKVNLKSQKGRWISPGLESSVGGLDVLVEHGEANLGLVSSDAGLFKISVESNDYKEEKLVSFSPDLRPLIAVGVVEGALGLSKINKEYIAEVNNFDNFESTINTVLGDEGKAGALGLRGALFLKGKVKGDYLLTLRYDSQSKNREQMFDNIDPNKFYPIYGDDSIRGSETNSLSPLFVRLEKGNSYILYGDYGTTNHQDSNRSQLVKESVLGEYQRNLTGLQGRFSNDTVKVDYFASYNRNQQHVITLRGQGISGPYDVDMGLFIKNSEKVTLITRSQAQPGLIIERVTLTRFADYVFDAFYNTILFSRPIPSVDADGNPIEIEITFEKEDNAKQHWVYGVAASVELSPYISIGATFAEDKDPTKPYKLYSANTIFQIVPTVALALEIARSEAISEQTLAANKGQAYRLELINRSKDGKFSARAYIYRADKLFRNDAAGISSGNLDSGLTLSYKVGDNFVLHAEGLYSRDLETKDARISALAAVEHTLTESLSGRVGIRYVQERSNDTSDNENSSSAFLRFMWQPKALPKLLAYIEGEQVLNTSTKHAVGVGAEYLITKNLALYGRHQFISKLDAKSSLNGSYGLSGNLESANKNVSAIGVKYNYAQKGSVFSEYRITDIIDGKQAEAAIGINNGFELFDGLELSTTFERIQPFIKSKTVSTAATLGLNYTTNSDWKATARLEWRGSEERNSWLNTIGLVKKINDDWSVLFSNILAYEANKNGAKKARRRNDGRIGVAYRDTKTNRLSLLVRYQMLLDRNDESIKKELSHVISAHANYQFNPKMVASGRYAFGYRQFDDNNSSYKLNAHLLMGRVTYDISDRIDIGVTAARLFSNDKAQRKSYGVEIGYLASKNLWFSVGYNFVGFNDRLLAGSDYTRRGLYLKMRFKFDEDLFRWLTD